MIGFIEGLLVLIGFLTVVGASAVALIAYLGERAVRFEVTGSDPYRDGLDASARISGMAREAEQAMHTAAKQAERKEKAKK